MSFRSRVKKAERKRTQKRIVLSPLHKQLIVGGVLFIVVALLLTAVWHITRLPSLQIAHVEVIGGETIPHAQIKDKVEQMLSGEYFKLIPRRFIPLYPKTQIAESLYSIDRIKNVHIERTQDQTLTIVFEEHLPYALWCEHNNDSECFFIDRAGFAFAQAPELQGSAFVRYHEEGVPPQKDHIGFSTILMDDAYTFIQLLEKEFALYVTHVEKVGEYDLEFSISEGGVIKVSQKIPLQESFDNLKAILLSEEFKHISPGSFQYIDLRFGEKIFVNEVMDSTQATTTASTSNSQ